MAATYFQVIPLLSTRGRHVVCLFSPVLQTHQMADSLPSEPSGKPSNAPGCHHAQSWILQPIVPSPQKVPSPPPSPPLVQLIPLIFPVSSSSASLSQEGLKFLHFHSILPLPFPHTPHTSNQLNAYFSYRDVGVNRAEITLVLLPSPSK